MKKSDIQHCSCGESSELREQAERSRKIINAIFDSTQSVIILVSLDHKILFFNKKAMHSSKILYGRALKVGDSFMAYKRKGDEAMFQDFKMNFNKAVTMRTIVISERQMHFHGVDWWFRTEYTPVYDQDEIIGVSLRVIDVSERKNREKQIEKQNEQLGKISWIQSHHTRQPIATILGLINILDKESLTADNHKIIEMLKVEIDKLDAIIRDIVIRANSTQ